MGLADLFARIGIAYDSDDALRFAGRIAEFLTVQARTVSAELGRRRGSFPAFAQSVWPQRGFTALRNATVTCVAPTGTISLIAGTTSSIEPYFALALSRRVLDGGARSEINPLLERELARLGDSSPALLDTLKQTGSLQNLSAVPAELRRRFRIALEIAPAYHVGMQAAFQDHIDAAVSKTVNLPADAPLSTVKEIFLLARQRRLKGITVYRYGCRPGQTLSLINEEARADCRECAA
jgi:ribonucleoside-diphosphate reductase alpha chain